MLPFEAQLRRERGAMLATVESLSDADFTGAPTLCEGWSPRDVLAHAVGVDDFAAVAAAFGNLGLANDRQVAKGRSMTRAEVTARAHRWAERPPLHARASAMVLLQDVSVHHQDVLRGLGRRREVPSYASAAILREGVLLGGAKLLSHRVVPTDGGRPLGRGRTVRGTREALGMWLTGRTSVASELEFE